MLRAPASDGAFAEISERVTARTNIAFCDRAGVPKAKEFLIESDASQNSAAARIFGRLLSPHPALTL
jgi:hypothetical protein